MRLARHMRAEIQARILRAYCKEFTEDITLQKEGSEPDKIKKEDKAE